MPPCRSYMPCHRCATAKSSEPLTPRKPPRTTEPEHTRHLSLSSLTSHRGTVPPPTQHPHRTTPRPRTQRTQHTKLPPPGAQPPPTTTRTEKKRDEGRRQTKATNHKAFGLKAKQSTTTVCPYDLKKIRSTQKIQRATKQRIPPKLPGKFSFVPVPETRWSSKMIWGDMVGYGGVWAP